MQIRSFKDPLSVYEYLSSLKTSNSNLFYRLLLDNLVEVCLSILRTLPSICIRSAHLSTLRLLDSPARCVRQMMLPVQDTVLKSRRV
jgi:hypothetical protein